MDAATEEATVVGDHGTAQRLAAVGITKRFGQLTANDHVDLSVAPGEIHALLGENGAGKSTLVKILYGALQPDAGEIVWNGEPVSIADPAAARRLGIGMVFQHFSLFEALTVADNIALALTDTGGMAALRERIAKVSAAYGLPLNPSSAVHNLSVGQRQRVEIVRCLLQEPQLIIMDEPTSVLTPQEADDLFVTLRKLAASGVSIIYISHRLEEVKQLCHRATILRHGKVVATCDPRQETAARLASMMVGSDLKAVETAAAERAGGSEVKLSVDRLSLPPPNPFAVALQDVSIAVRAGEILGIAGIAGNGQDELFDALSGERLAPRPGMVTICGTPSGRLGVTARRRLGAAFVPEERLGHGAVPRLPLSKNTLLTRHATGGLVRGGFIRMGEASSLAAEVTADFDVRKGTADPEATALSGGNLQKFVVGREIHRQPGVLVVSQPTWGVDAGAATLIRQALIDLARAGSAILMFSQDLDEILEISDRVAVISEGRLSEPKPAGGMTREAIGLLMGGIRASERDPEVADAP